ncbi:MAG: SH3 domain-containing protein [Planctomycetota bacterium]
MLAFVVLALGFSTHLAAQGSFPCYGRVSGDRVRIRTGPSLNHFAFASLALSTEVVADGQDQEWIRIYLPPHQRCWVHADFLQVLPEGGLQVTGSRVRVRCTPNTKYTPIGQVNKGQRLQPTGTMDETGKWAECLAPFGTKVYIHKDYLELGGRIPAGDLAATIRGLKPPASVRPIGDAPGPGSDTPPDRQLPGGNGAEGAAQGLRMPAPSQFSPRLRELYGRFELERKKPPIEWDFDDILSELESIRRNTEDLGELENAERWKRWITEHLLPIRDPLVEIEKQKEIQRRRRENAAKLSEGQIEKGVHVYEPGGGQDREYLATGWVVAMGKRTAVDATHKLMKGNKLLFYLRAEQYDLDDFVNKRVGIQGTLQELAPEHGARLVRVTSLKSLSAK